MNVTSEQLEFYREEGYIVFPGALTDDDLEPLIQTFSGVDSTRGTQTVTCRMPWASVVVNMAS